jgi:uncharacterized zinc-type alcohol dehydrogenase-like protein
MRIRSHVALAPKSSLVTMDLEAPPLGPHDVELEVDHCGLCHSDLHLIDDAWGSSTYPLVPGHEIVGHVTEVGAAVANLAVGQRVGVGWQRSACLACDLCLAGEENLCAAQEATCSGHPGGLADRVRVDGRFAFPIPDALDSAVAAPLLCGGVTVYAPMRRYGVDATKSVGVIGIGGLGHMALLFLRAFGCEITAFSSSPAKEGDALAMGAHHFVASTEPRALRSQFDSLDLLISTVHVKMDWAMYLQTLKPNGTLCLVGMPPGLLSIPALALLPKQRSITASDIGGRATIAEMLAFAARHRIAPEVEQMPMEELGRAIDRLRRNEVRYRVVLTNR